MEKRVQHRISGALAVLLTIVPVMLPTTAAATEWALAPERSRIGFEYQQNRKPTEGMFTRFDGEGEFDPAAPAHATLELRIESGSIDLNDNLASAFATSAEWFDSAIHPLVTYRLTSLEPLGGDDYKAQGTLTIRGRTRPIETTITLVLGADEAHAEGVLDIDRRDYGLGVGPSAIFVEIGSEVAVHFELTAAAAR